jgi:lysophospholipase L1-like esterase
VAFLLLACGCRPAALPSGRAAPGDGSTVRGAASTAASSRKAPPAAAAPGLVGVRRIVCLGDSITELGDGPGGYVRLLRERLRRPEVSGGGVIDVINAGVAAETSRDMAARFPRDVLARRPDLVILSVGINDVWHGFEPAHPAGDGPRGVPLGVFRDRVAAMLAAARRHGLRIAVLSTPVIGEDLASPENARLSAYNAVLREECAAAGGVFVDVNAAFHRVLRAAPRGAAARGRLTTDGVHLNAAGNRLFAQAILAGLGVPAAGIADLQPAAGTPALGPSVDGGADRR